MKQQHAITQVSEVSLRKDEIQMIVVEYITKMGADPSYDFDTTHPIFIWDKDGGLAVRFVQSAVTARESQRFIELKCLPTSAEIREIMRKREEETAKLMKRPVDAGEKP